MRCEEAQELITARVDGELTTDEELAIEVHLEACAACRQACAAESQLKQQIRLASFAVAAPASLRQAIQASAAREREPAGPRRRRGLRRWFGAGSGWRPAFAAAVLALTLAGLIYTRWPEKNIGVEALETHASILSGKTVLARADNPALLRDELAHAVGGRFKPVALDFSLIKLYPVSGFVQRIGDRDVLVTVYEGDGPAITCFTFLGDEGDAPPESEKFYDSDMRINFYSFAREGVNGLMHRDGNVVCVLASKMPAADLLALVRGKSAHA
jgi:anti-sigma factor RsiW